MRKMYKQTVSGITVSVVKLIQHAEVKKYLCAISPCQRACFVLITFINSSVELSPHERHAFSCCDSNHFFPALNTYH